MKEILIVEIREKYNISLSEISKYKKENIEEIEHISNIFDLQGNNKKKVLALLYLFSLGEEDDVIKKYRKQTSMNSIEYKTEELIEEYKILLVSALIYKASFYAMAENYRGFVNAGLSVGATQKWEIKKPIFVNRKRLYWAIGAAAVIVCAFIPVFIYFKGQSSNNIAEIDDETTEQSITSEIASGDPIPEENKDKPLPEQAPKKPTTPKQEKHIINSAGAPEIAYVDPIEDDNYVYPETRIQSAPPVRQSGSVINVPNNITHIADYMYADTNLQTVILHSGVIAIGKGAFKGNPLVQIIIDENVEMAEDSFPGNFYSVYNDNKKAAGLYYRNSADENEWSKR